MRGNFITTRTERTSVTIDTPIGPREATYSGGAYRSDAFTITYRGQELFNTSIDRLRHDIEKAEAEHQSKAAVAAARKAVAADPLPALLAPRYLSGGTGRWTEGDDCEEIHVRGIDQRSGKALVTRANGDKEQIDGRFLLRLLAVDERSDVVRSFRKVANARRRAQETGGRKIADVLAEHYAPFEALVRLDPETFERTTVYGGHEFRAGSEREVKRALMVHLITPHAPFAVDGKRVEDVEHLHESTAVLPTREAVEAHLAAQADVEAAAAEYEAYVEDYRFDLTLLSGATQPQPEESEGAAVPNVKAPAGAGDWD